MDDIINKVLNIIIPPISLTFFLFLLPPYLFYKFLLSAVRSVFSEDVAGKVVLITGASSGIGEHMTYEYARRGACLALVARRENLLQSVASRAMSIGSPDVLVIPADVSKVENCRRFVDVAVNHFGRWVKRSGSGAMDGMAMAESTSTPPLTSIVEAFEELGKFLQFQQQQQQRLSLDTFCQASSLVSILFSCLGLAFKFAEMEYVSKVDDLMEASKTYDTLESIIDFDVANDTVKTPGSHSRNLRRVRQGLDLIRALFEQFLSTDDYSLREAASTAYAQVCAPYHSWTIRTAVAAGMYALPSRDQLLVNLEETHQSAEKKMKRYIRASRPVIEYIDKLYLSRSITLDW